MAMEIENHLLEDHIEALKTLRKAEGGLPLERKIFRPNQTIIEEGRKEDFMYIVLEGGLVVSRKNNSRFRVDLTGSGVFTGEIAALFPALRTATIRAWDQSPVTAFKLTTADVVGLCYLRYPYTDVYRIISCTAAKRLSEMDDNSLNNVYKLPPRTGWIWSETFGIQVPPLRNVEHTKYILPGQL